MTRSTTRTGAVAPMFALILPVLFILAGMAVNIAYMQLVSTELKIAADASAHAAGRSMSINQTTEAAIATARTIAAMNQVGGSDVQLTITDDDEDITFGQSIRADNGYGRYEFTGWTQNEVDAGEKRATSVAIEAVMNVPLIFATIPGVSESISVRERSVATQVDRDIALVLDRSGSMLYYENETALSQALLDLYNTYEQIEVETSEGGFWRYRWWAPSGGWWGGWTFLGWASFDEASSNGWYYYSSRPRRWVEGETTTQTVDGDRLISQQEYNNATDWLYDRRYSQNVIDQLATISPEMSEYAETWMDMINSSSSWTYRTPAPTHSRWANLVEGVDAFLTVLESTDQDELVALVTFNSYASLDLTLQSDYSGIRNEIASIVPYDGTAIGSGMETGHPELMDGTESRLFAAKTIVVLSDGESNNGTDPETAAENIVGQDAVTIHTVTFATDDQDALNDMKDVAAAGNGKHYHADTGDQLISTFEEIANNLPTILSE